MLHNAAESQTNELTISIETAYAAELFSKLSATAQDEIIDLLKSLLSDE
jgi:hypothetical protein